MIARNAVGLDAVGMAGAVAASASAPGAALASATKLVAGLASAGGQGGPTAVAGNAPGAALSSSTSIAAGMASSATVPAVITVAASRIAVFAGGSRVVLFGTENAPKLLQNGPYLKNKKWTINKAPLDKLWYVADVSRVMLEAGTVAVSCVALVNGVMLLEGPVIQGGLISVKIGGLNTATNFDNYVTLRISCANGEQIDKSIHFTLLDDRSWTFPKDPDDLQYFAIDCSADLGYSLSTLASVQAPTPVGVNSLMPPVAQDNLAIVKLGGLDLAGTNSCMVPITFASGEQIFRTIYFTQTDN
jgi:hypothetical protein